MRGRDYPHFANEDEAQKRNQLAQGHESSLTVHLGLNPHPSTTSLSCLFGVCMVGQVWDSRLDLDAFIPLHAARYAPGTALSVLINILSKIILLEGTWTLIRILTRSNIHSTLGFAYLLPFPLSPGTLRRKTFRCLNGSCFHVEPV